MVVSEAPSGSGARKVGPLTVSDADHAHGAQTDVAGRRGRVVAFVAGQAERHGDDGDDASRSESDRRTDRDDLDHPAVHVVVVGQRRVAGTPRGRSPRR